ncbi:MAG: hypothetical protein KBT11_02940 [Treponema sp.]|nr:hypothetical protein [Candidatus Treponema equifaecale]
MSNKKSNFGFSLLSAVFALVFSFLLYSCADSEADVVFSAGTVIFDFADEETVANTRLAVYVQTSSEVQRADYFTAENEDSGWIWTVHSPEMFSVDSKQYAFASNLRSPQGESIPQGKYNVVYYDAAGKSDEMAFEVKYNKDLLKVKSEKSPELVPNKTEYLAIYDNQDELLFMGKRKNNWRDNAAILKDYKIGHKIRVCYANPSNTVVCLMPAQLLKEE